jgi:quercetin dioxygenase-like cupin family protein
MNQQVLTPLHSGNQMMVFGHLFTFLATTEESNNQYCVYEDNVPPQAGPPPHSHPDEELFYVISGKFEFVLHDPSRPFSVVPGQLIKIPSNAIHTFKNVGTTTGRLLTIILPGNLEKYFRETFPVLKANDKLPDLTKAPDFANMDLSKAFNLAEKHQIQFHLPKREAVACE